jgi:hypothetical protein
MEVLVFLVPLALMLGLIGLVVGLARKCAYHSLNDCFCEGFRMPAP